MNFDEEKRETLGIEGLIIESVTEWSIVRKINITLFVINVLENKGKITKELKDMKKKILDFYNDPAMYRVMNYRDALMRQNRAEYYGKDYGGINDPYYYNKKVEEFVVELNRVIIGALAKAYLELTEKEELDISTFEVKA